MFIWEGVTMSENKINLSIEFSDETFSKFLAVLKEVADRDLQCDVHISAPRKKKFNFPKSRD